jgi:hypothetical protein
MPQPTELAPATERESNLREALRRSAAQISELERSKKSEAQKRRRWESRCCEARAELAQLQAQALRKTDLARFSAYGGMCLAIRRCASNASAKNLGLALEVDVHQTTVNRWEIKCDAALIAASRGFYAEVDAAAEDTDADPLALVDAQAPGSLAVAAPPDWSAAVVVAQTQETALASATPHGSCALHLIRSDATNAAVWQKCKLHTCEAATVVLYGGTAGGCAGADADAKDALQSAFAMHAHRRLADLQVVTDATGEGCFAMTCRQLENIGVPLWTSAGNVSGLAV